MLLGMVPWQVFAKGYKAEITFIREDTNQTVTKTFTNPEEELGFNDMTTNDGGVYFMGWSPNQQLTVEQDELYFAHEKVGDLFPTGRRSRRRFMLNMPIYFGRLCWLKATESA